MVGIFLAIILGLIPSFTWLIFFLKEDTDRPEPKKTVFFTFIAGMAVAFLAIGPQLLISKWLSAIGLNLYGPIPFFVLAAVEEFLKFAAVYLVVSRRKEFDEPTDAMLYMIISALGFAATENAALIIPGGAISSNFTAVETIILRFIGATLLHALCSGLFGYYWALTMVKKVSCFGYIALMSLGIGIATLLHAFFNYSIIKFGPLSLTTIILVFVAFFIFQDFEKLKAVEDRMNNKSV